MRSSLRAGHPSVKLRGCALAGGSARQWVSVAKAEKLAKANPPWKPSR